MEDIPLLVDHFIAKLNRIRGRAVTGIDRRALEILMAHDFPGNVRELENIVEHAFAIHPEGEISPARLPGCLTRESAAATACADENDPVKAAEIKMVMDALERNDYNRQAAAADLGIHKSTLFRKLKKLGLSPPKRKG
jgi:transcriptional regulator with PAS, ATPase and Fis domain